MTNYTDPVILRKGSGLSTVNPKIRHVRLTAIYCEFSMIFGFPIPPSLSDSNCSGCLGKDAHGQNHLPVVHTI